jgi:hypothetical protein
MQLVSVVAEAARAATMGRCIKVGTMAGLGDTDAGSCGIQLGTQSACSGRYHGQYDAAPLCNEKKTQRTQKPHEAPANNWHQTPKALAGAEKEEMTRHPTDSHGCSSSSSNTRGMVVLDKKTPE